MDGDKLEAISLDFGEGFYCTKDNIICKRQALSRARTKAESLHTSEAAFPVIMNINVKTAINTDSSLKCVYFDGSWAVDGKEWAEFIVHHRIEKDSLYCTNSYCNGHPDIMIGPVADGNAISLNAEKVRNGKISILPYNINKGGGFYVKAH